MKKTFIFTIGIIFFLVQGTVLAKKITLKENEAEAVAVQFFEPLFEALKKGDLKSLKQNMTEEMYQRYRKLLEENKEYSNFLQEYYRNAHFSVIAVKVIDNYIDVELRIEFLNGNSGRAHVKLLQPYADIDDIDGQSSSSITDISRGTSSGSLPDSINNINVWKFDR